MRELSSSRPLVIGVWASLVFFGSYFAVAHLVGWHNPAPWESAIGEASRWCERVAPGAFREPVNALSNIGFMLGGLWMLWVLGRDERAGLPRVGLQGFTSSSLVYAGAAWFLGPGSLMMHGTHAAWGGWLDNLSMVMYILIPWMLNLSQMGRWSMPRFLWTYAAVVAVYALLRGLYGWGLGMNLDLFGLSIALWVITEFLYRFWSPTFRWLSGGVGFIVAAVFGITPLEMAAAPEKYWWVVLFWLPALVAKEAPVRRRNYWPWFLLGVFFYLSASAIWQTGKPDHPWCDPDSLIQAHGIWHLMTAVATVCFFVFLRTEREKEPLVT